MKTITVERDGKIYAIPVDPVHKSEFERRHGEGSLERLYGLLALDCNNFAEVGKDFVLTRERIRQIYQKRLAPYLPKKSGMERIRACSLKRPHISGGSYPDHVLNVWKEARKQGINVYNITYRRSSGGIITLKKVLFLNDIKCAMRICSNIISSTNRHTRAYFSETSLNNLEFQILVVKIRGLETKYFIIPSKAVLESGLTLQKIRRTPEYALNIPIYPDATNRIADWRQYENAWHLLQPKNEPRAQS